jgi:hypothetical protein
VADSFFERVRVRLFLYSCRWQGVHLSALCRVSRSEHFDLWLAGPWADHFQDGAPAASANATQDSLRIHSRLIYYAALIYPPGRTYPGTVVLCHALTQPAGIKPDPTLGWGHPVTGDLKIIDVSGTHNSILLHDLHVAELVHKISDHLSQLPDRLPAGKLISNGFSSTDSAILSVN